MRESKRLPAHIVETIADPFDVFPLSDALDGIAGLVDERFADLWAQYEDVAPKFREVGLECGLEGVGILIGAGFVAAQAILTRTHTAVKRIADYYPEGEASKVNLPVKKHVLFSLAAHDRDGVSDIQGINALANCFKHESEWQCEWDQARNRLEWLEERKEVQIVRQLGLKPHDPENMARGARSLGFGDKEGGLGKLATRLQDWREDVATNIRDLLLAADLLDDA